MEEKYGVKKGPIKYQVICKSCKKTYHMNANNFKSARFNFMISTWVIRDGEDWYCKNNKCFVEEKAA